MVTLRCRRIYPALRTCKVCKNGKEEHDEAPLACLHVLVVAGHQRMRREWACKPMFAILRTHPRALRMAAHVYAYALRMACATKVQALAWVSAQTAGSLGMQAGSLGMQAGGADGQGGARSNVT